MPSFEVVHELSHWRVRHDSVTGKIVSSHLTQQAAIASAKVHASRAKGTATWRDRTGRVQSSVRYRVS